jgi:nucleotide-binding universal stress UspA family protein
MFKKILVPVSSEFYSKNVINRSIFLAEIFNSIVHILFIIEDTPLQQMERSSDAHLTHYDREETHYDLLYKQRKTADNILFEHAKQIFDKRNRQMKHTIVHGEFSTIVEKELEKNQYDLVLMGYEKGTMIDYRILNETLTPLWIEGEGYHTSILAVCSNLAPNQKVPAISLKLAYAFHWDLSMLYVIDTQDTVKVDTNGIRSPKKPKIELQFHSQNFSDDMKEKQINVKTVEGSLEQQTIKEAKNMEAGLVIIGREQKKRGLLGLPVKNLKQKIIDKSKHSYLFVN